MVTGQHLKRDGHEVFGVRRTEPEAAVLQNAGITPLTADITQPETLAKLPTPFDWVVNTTSSNRGGPRDYRRVFFEGTRNLLSWLEAAPPQKYIHTSSTSVYGQNDGSVVKESSPTEPSTETGSILVETEQLLLNSAREKKFPAMILRVAGIYGPDRGHLFLQYLKNQAAIAGKGERYLNMVHLEDVAGCIVAALKDGQPGEIYNVVDDEPVTQFHFFRWLSETLGKPMPASVHESGDPVRKRGITNKRVSNRKLKMELGYQFRYPTFREGYTAEITRLEREGKMLSDLKPAT